MDVFKGYKNVPKEFMGSCVAIGNFDGMHLGHQELLKVAKKNAKKLVTHSLVYTFEPHPSQVLSGGKKLPLIFTKEQKIQSLENYGMSGAVFEPFNNDFAKISAEDFVNEILINSLKVAAIVVGENFTFGYKAKGNVKLLKQILAKKGVLLNIVSPILVSSSVCSSTFIRKFILQGEVEKASKMLSQPYLLAGVVVKGHGRGKKLNIPSANLKTNNELVPKNGVYATRVEIENDNKKYLGATNIGFKPTFNNNEELSIETHILDFAANIYGKKIKLSFLKKIRDEKRFSSSAELVKQINKDILTIKKVNY
ncbi:bifunctional riboflavin kinase/FAD synthetase [Sulfobacillus acidophilus]|uniref:Riboflavin biosynthesis protein n=1 Tax=Sulfobacillus acidophilus TaxID=53633 RepID=A0ABS3AVW6_9FIRM|nr:bifunctional riboflavin kinase/FAD synthetase [Sulfobacillus acidophilus]